MSSIRQKAREAQVTEFNEHGTPEQQDLADKAAALYDMVDALTPANRDLLVQTGLSAVHGMLDDIAEDPSAKFAARSILGVVGYANETNREDRGETSTGDRAVDEVLQGIKDMLQAQLLALLGGERGKEVTDAAERVKARIAAGEDPETAAADEAEKIGLNRPVAAPAASTGARPDDGLYL